MELKEEIENGNLLSLKDELIDTNSVDLAQSLDELNLEDILKIFNLIGTEKASEVFPYLSIDIRENLILNLSNDFLHELLEYLYTDDIKDILDYENKEVEEKIFEIASHSRKMQLNIQLNYNENSAGSIMSADFVKISQDDSAFIAMKKIKSQEKIAETISYCYVTNENSILIGLVSMKDILISQDDTLIGDIMETDVISVDVDDDQEYVAQTMSKYDLLALPVVDNNHHILGIVTIDDVLDIIESETTEDIQRMSGINPTDGNYLDQSSFEISKSRIAWLLILMVSATVSGSIVTANSDITSISSILAFMPMIMDTAGNAGCQSSAMVIRGIIVDDMKFSNLFSIIKKELYNSLILGSILFIINTLRIIIFMPSVKWETAILVSLTILIIVTMANLIGGILPMIGLYLKLDPASMSGPVLTTACDAISLTTYFTLARIFIAGGLI